MKSHYLALLFALGLYFSGLAQSRLPFSNHAAAALGYSVIAEELPEGFYYKPFTILPSVRIWRKGAFTVYAEGQFTQAAIPFSLEAEYEGGANVGVRYLLPLDQQLTLSAAVATGPHYITVETRRQANGFIFSDNFELALEYYIKSIATALQARGRFRHISNAGLKSPNGGIDNLFLVIGLATRW